MKKLLSFIKGKRLSCCLFFLVVCYSTATFSQNYNDFNLPPGAKIHEKKFKYIDYRYKLNVVNGNEPLEKNWLVKFTQEDLNVLKNKNIQQYNYYIIAREYFMSLSDKVKSIFTIQELWHIYMFDQSLKNKLKTIN